MVEDRVIDHIASISPEEAREILSGISQLPMATPLVKLFERATRAETYRAGRAEHSGIYGDIKDLETGSMVLRQRHEYVDLDILPWLVEEIPKPLPEIIRYDMFACVSAGPRRVGAWGYGKGHETVYGIRVDMGGGLGLPSRSSRWLFDQMKILETLAEEFCPYPSEQPRFWTGSKESPD